MPLHSIGIPAERKLQGLGDKTFSSSSASCGLRYWMCSTNLTALRRFLIAGSMVSVLTLRRILAFASLLLEPVCGADLDWRAQMLGHRHSHKYGHYLNQRGKFAFSAADSSGRLFLL